MTDSGYEIELGRMYDKGIDCFKKQLLKFIKEQKEEHHMFMEIQKGRIIAYEEVLTFIEEN